jgi:hypothetical protein
VLQELSAKITIGSVSIALSRFLGLEVVAFLFSLYRNPLLHIALASDSLAAYGKSRNPIKNSMARNRRRWVTVLFKLYRFSRRLNGVFNTLQSTFFWEIYFLGQKGVIRDGWSKTGLLRDWRCGDVIFMWEQVSLRPSYAGCLSTWSVILIFS